MLPYFPIYGRQPLFKLRILRHQPFHSHTACLRVRQGRVRDVAGPDLRTLEAPLRVPELLQDMSHDTYSSHRRLRTGGPVAASSRGELLEGSRKSVCHLQ